MTSSDVFLTIVLFIILVLSSVSIVFGVPGNVISFLAILAFVLLTKAKFMGWAALLGVLLLVIAGEVGEFYFGLKGARRGGVSKRGAMAAVIGGIAGSLALAPFLLGIGAIIGALVGSFLGAFFVSLSENKMTSDAVGGGWFAAIGRLKGIIFKGFVAFLITLLALISILI